MKTWNEFNETVNELLLVDGLRKGRGVERYRDRMIVAGARDLQRHIPQYRTIPETVSFESSDLDLHGEEKCNVGSFDYVGTRILDCIVRQLPTETKDVSTYFRLKYYPAKAKWAILDGGHSSRSSTYPGKICFDEGQFFTGPILKSGETLNILFSQEFAYKPMFQCSETELNQKTPFGDDAAMAVHYFVKYHFHKDVNDDQAQAQGNYQNYQRERRSLAVNERELVATADPELSFSSNGFVIGNG